MSLFNVKSYNAFEEENGRVKYGKKRLVWTKSERLSIGLLAL